MFEVKMSSLYKESLEDARKIIELATNNAKETLIESVLPDIKKAVLNMLNESTNDDSNEKKVKLELNGDKNMDKELEKELQKTEAKEKEDGEEELKEYK